MQQRERSKWCDDLMTDTKIQNLLRATDQDQRPPLTNFLKEKEEMRRGREMCTPSMAFTFIATGYSEND